MHVWYGYKCKPKEIVPTKPPPSEMEAQLTQNRTWQFCESDPLTLSQGG